MNKIIFQLGLLAFFVSIVFFASQNHPMLDTIARSFIIFVGVVFFVAMVVAVSVLFTNKTKSGSEIESNVLKSQRKFDVKGNSAEPIAKSVV